MSEEAIDVNEFLERVQDDKELLLELLDIFSDDFKQKRQSLQSAVNNSNQEEIKSIAHSLKGASGNISAKPFREICLKIEEAVKNNDISVVGDLLSDIDQQFEKLSSRMTQLKEELKS